MSIVRQDTFARANVASSWGTATDGNTWTSQAGSGGYNVTSNEGVLTGLSSASYFNTLGAALSTADGEALVRFSPLTGTSNDTAGVFLRFANTSNYYLARWNASTAQIQFFKKVSGASTTVGSYAISVSVGAKWWLRFRVQGTAISIKTWLDGNTEPSSWSYTTTDTSLSAAGLTGIYGFAGASGDNVQFDSFSVDNLATNDALTGTAAATSSPTGALAVTHVLAATAPGTSSPSGPLAVVHALTGSAPGTSAPSALLHVAHTLAGTAASVATPSGAPHVGHALAGSATGASSPSATLTHSGHQALAGTAPGTSSPTGALHIGHALAGSVAGASSPTGVLAITRHPAGTAAATSSPLGILHVGHALSGTATSVTTPSASVHLTHNLAGTVTGTSSPSATLTHGGVSGTGIGDLAVTTKSQSWSGGPTGSPGTETDVTYTDSSNSGWAVGLIPSYGGMPISSWYEVDSGVVGGNQTSLATSTPDGHVHWLEQSSGSVFAGSEDKAFTMVELAPTGTAFRRYYQCSFGPDANGFNWVGYACIYPGDPGFIVYRFDITNPSGSAITFNNSGAAAMDVALIGGLEQTDGAWIPTNGGYGTVGGANTVGWPSTSTGGDPDYVYITPVASKGVSLGQLTVRQKAFSALSPAWSTPNFLYLQNSNRLKFTVQGGMASFPASTTSTAYFLNVMRRSLTAADAAAIAADYLAPGTPSASVGSFTSFSYDEAAWVFAASAPSKLTATLDMTPSHVTVRYKPRLKITGWTASATPLVQLAGVTLVAGADYRVYVDTTNHILYLHLYFDVVASGAVAGQRNNGALSVTPTPVALAGTASASSSPTGALSVTDTLAGVAAATSSPSGLLRVAHALTGTAPGVATPSATLTRARHLASTAAATSSPSGALHVAHALAGSGTGVSGPSGAVTVTHALAGAAVGTSSPSGHLATRHALAGAAAAGTSVTSGGLTTHHALSATAASMATPSASLNAHYAGAMSATASASATVTGALRVLHALGAVSGSYAPPSGSLAITRGLSGAARSVASATATLHALHALGGVTGARAWPTGSLTLILSGASYHGAPISGASGSGAGGVTATTITSPAIVSTRSG